MSVCWGREALIKKIEEEHTTLRTTQQTRLSALEAEQARLVIENSSLKQLLRDSTGKAQELMEHTDKLAAALEKVNAQNKNSSDLLNKELEDVGACIHANPPDQMHNFMLFYVVISAPPPGLRGAEQAAGAGLGGARGDGQATALPGARESAAAGLHPERRTGAAGLPPSPLSAPHGGVSVG
ncbi:hypothetical protein EON64_12560 [archaeon]|nr:MAG: hypothetical protein EON64_12560 [archaeon]